MPRLEFPMVTLLSTLPNWSISPILPFGALLFISVVISVPSHPVSPPTNPPGGVHPAKVSYSPDTAGGFAESE